MSDLPSGVIVFFFFTFVYAVVYWKQGMVPWWIACLIPLLALVGLVEHNAGRILASPLLLAGITVVVWPEGALRYYARQRKKNSITTFASSFITKPLVVRLMGVIAIAMAIGFWVANFSSTHSRLRGHVPTEQH